MNKIDFTLLLPVTCCQYGDNNVINYTVLQKNKQRYLTSILMEGLLTKFTNMEKST